MSASDLGRVASRLDRGACAQQPSAQLLSKLSHYTCCKAIVIKPSHPPKICAPAGESFPHLPPASPWPLATIPLLFQNKCPCG